MSRIEQLINVKLRNTSTAVNFSRYLTSKIIVNKGRNGRAVSRASHAYPRMRSRNTRRSSASRKTILSDAQAQSDSMLADAKKQSDSMIAQATEQANTMVEQATEQANTMVAQADAQTTEMVNDHEIMQRAYACRMR